MPEEESDTRPSTGGFGTSWCGTDLGEYRECRYTYELYSMESLPPLEPGRFAGDFRWYGDIGPALPERLKALADLDEQLSALGVALPGDFVTFQASANLHLSLDEVSVTACWSHLSAPLASPVEDGAFLVRFLRDQQDCVIWYLYLRPSQDAFVVHSFIDYESEYEAQDYGEQTRSDLQDPDQQRAALQWCASSFEEFAYRNWIENRLWHAVHQNPRPALPPDEAEYLRHYAPIGDRAQVWNP